MQELLVRFIWFWTNIKCCYANFGEHKADHENIGLILLLKRKPLLWFANLCLIGTKTGRIRCNTKNGMTRYLPRSRKRQWTQRQWVGNCLFSVRWMPIKHMFWFHQKIYVVMFNQAESLSTKPLLTAPSFSLEGCVYCVTWFAEEHSISIISAGEIWYGLGPKGV